MDFNGAATPLQDGDIEEVATWLSCEVAAVKAVCSVEAAGHGFLPDGRPKILFEAHVFGRLTDHRYDDEHPNISAPSWDRSLYGAGGAHQYDRLAEAMALDEEAALKSASWGMFQIMGMNAGICGYVLEGTEKEPDVRAFVTDMLDSERNHLIAFARFCRETGAARHLVNQDWRSFARVYNGPGQVEAYADRLAEAYESAA